MNNDRLISEAVRRAQREARAQGLRVGTTVAVPYDPVAYELLSVTGETATVGHADVQREYPVIDLFDANRARSIALQMLGEFN